MNPEFKMVAKCLFLARIYDKVPSMVFPPDRDMCPDYSRFLDCSGHEETQVASKIRLTLCLPIYCSVCSSLKEI